MADGSAAPRREGLKAGLSAVYDAGYEVGYREGLEAVVLIAAADVALAKLPLGERRAIWEQALYDVGQQHGELPAPMRKAIAALRIVELAER